ncbi:nitric oxide reductase [Edwardsiella tarda]|uniref:nitric oxide reductase n=1 Tax=Edwardsiella tarda TaxID=636 RepID=UPI00098F75F9|nr:nitric oxide reductase [Edwardsiella tarda]
MKITISLGDIFLFIMIIAITLYAIWLPPSGEPAWLASSIDYIEQGQALWLAFVVLFIPYRCWRERLDAGDRRFWYWATLWWITLLGRSISWGRVYFPHGPRLLFHSIAALLIAVLLLSLLSSQLRRAIAARYRLHPIPVWRLVAVVLAFACADAVEHQRALAHPLLSSASPYRDLIEELYECPFLIGLFLITLHMLNHERYLRRQHASKA